MTNDELASRYRNLIIALCRHTSGLRAEHQLLREAAAFEQNPGRKAGLYCKANTIIRGAGILSAMIGRNRQAMKAMFGTANIESVAEEEMCSNKQSLTDTTPL